MNLAGILRAKVAKLTKLVFSQLALPYREAFNEGPSLFRVLLLALQRWRACANVPDKVGANGKSPSTDRSPPA